VQADLQRAMDALKVNDADTAAREYRAALQLDPQNIDARANLGVIAFMQGQYSEAAQDFQEVLELQPSLWKVQAMLGLCEKQLGHMDAARTWFEKSFPHLEDSKLRIQVGLDLVGLDDQVGEQENAVDVLRTLRQLDPQNVDILYAAYRNYSSMAESTLDTLALVATDSPRMHLIIAEHLINEGDLKSAIAEYKKALELDPHLPGAHLELGEALLHESKSPESQQEAEEDFKTELALNPGDVVAECRLGDLYQSNIKLDLDAAYKSYARALQLQPNYADAQIGMGRVLARMGQQQAAVDHLLEAIRLDPVNSNVHYRLAQLYRKMGRSSDADREMATFEQVEKVKEHIRAVYREMHQAPREEQPLDRDAPQ
jgi:tetratricopeptide (TPR) repeat protein